MATDQRRYVERKVEELINARIKAGQWVRRATLTDEFGFTPLSASQHIQRFIKRNPGVLTYDMTVKAYCSTNQPPKGQSDPETEKLNDIIELVMAAKIGLEAQERNLAAFAVTFLSADKATATQVKIWEESYNRMVNNIVITKRALSKVKP